MSSFPGNIIAVFTFNCRRMKKHTRIYMDHFGYRIPEDAVCEVTGEPAQDVHHIWGRGPGQDRIENLMGLSRRIHDEVHWENAYTKQELQELHNRFLKQHEKKKNNAFF